MRKKGISLIVLVITIIIVIIITTISIASLLGENGIIAKANEAKFENDSKVKEEELSMIALDLMHNSFSNDTRTNTKAISTIDFVAPYLLNEYTDKQIDDYIKLLKRAGYKELIIQNVLNADFDSNSNRFKVSAAWFNSNLIDNIDELELYRPQVIEKIMNAAEKNDVKVYIGLVSSKDWWDYKFTNETWKNASNTFINSLVDELYEKFKNYTCFSGWYWTYEMYCNDKNYFSHWIDMINNNINHINEIENNNRHPIIISPFYSNLFNLTSQNITTQVDNFVNQVNFQPNDMIYIQDCLVTSNFLPSEVLENYIKPFKTSITSSNKNIKFGISVESYKKDYKGNHYSADLNRYINQLTICATQAESLASFSYSHYILNNIIADKNYRNYYSAQTNKIKHVIETPKDGSVFEDINGDEVPVPKGFKINEQKSIVKNGLVITDSYGNEYVWVPVNGVPKDKGYEYLNTEYEVVNYTRYINNGLSLSNVSNDILPVGVSSDITQIEKYGGFYVGRYETSYNYNNGSPTIQIKNIDNTKVSTTFSWQYANSSFYTGYLLNNINYLDAKRLAENMSKVYKYVNVKTGIINGTQWDTMLKWIHSNDSTFSLITNGTTWGNYTDSSSPATSGNYEQGIIKQSGSNENWQMLNIYDIAGNLSEWTSELSSSTPILRSNGYNDNGTYGSPSYSWSAQSAQYPNVGFRIVLYID